MHEARVDLVCKEGTHPFLRDLPDAELLVLDREHYPPEYKLDEIYPLLLDFLDRTIAAA